jgi:hypothetical protein
VKINGVRGGWLAEVEGRWLAVLHHTLRHGPDRSRAPIRPQDVGTKRLHDLQVALRTHDLVVVQRDRDPVSLARDGYIGVFRFTDLTFDGDREFSLRLTEKYAEPKA